MHLISTSSDLSLYSLFSSHQEAASHKRPSALFQPKKIKLNLMSLITCQNSKPYRTVKTVSISFSELKDKNSDLFAKIEKGFGPDGLGIISISDVPDFPVARQNLLQLAHRVANLPDDVKSSLEDPESRYNYGWNYGKMKLESGKLDTTKGSFFANPILDVPTNDVSLRQRYPSSCGSNKWPYASLPELEIAFKALGKLMLDVGLMLAYHCDQYVSKTSQLKEYEGLEKIINRSRCLKGRLLYYFPKLKSECLEDSGSVSSWFGWHTDYGSLTGLTSGMFTKDGVKIECPDTAAGLYIKACDGEIVKVAFGEEEMAFQIGETTEILSEGRLCATPHCVRAPKGEDAVGVGRSTFAMFMQPDWDEKLKFPAVVHHHKELIPPNGSLTFGEYLKTLLNTDYISKSSDSEMKTTKNAQPN